MVLIDEVESEAVSDIADKSLFKRAIAKHTVASGVKLDGETDELSSLQKTLDSWVEFKDRILSVMGTHLPLECSFVEILDNIRANGYEKLYNSMEALESEALKRNRDLHKRTATVSAFDQFITELMIEYGIITPTVIYSYYNKHLTMSVWSEVYWHFFHLSSILLQHCTTTGVADNKDKVPRYRELNALFEMVITNFEDVLICGKCAVHFIAFKKTSVFTSEVITPLRAGHSIYALYILHILINHNRDQQEDGIHQIYQNTYCVESFMRQWYCVPLCIPRTGNYSVGLTPQDASNAIPPIFTHPVTGALSATVSLFYCVDVEDAMNIIGLLGSGGEGTIEWLIPQAVMLPECQLNNEQMRKSIVNDLRENFNLHLREFMTTGQLPGERSWFSPTQTMLHARRTASHTNRATFAQVYGRYNNVLTLLKMASEEGDVDEETGAIVRTIIGCSSVMRAKTLLDELKFTLEDGTVLFARHIARGEFINYSKMVDYVNKFVTSV